MLGAEACQGQFPSQKQQTTRPTEDNIIPFEKLASDGMVQNLIFSLTFCLGNAWSPKPRGDSALVLEIRRQSGPFLSGVPLLPPLSGTDLSPPPKSKGHLPHRLRFSEVTYSARRPWIPRDILAASALQKAVGFSFLAHYLMDHVIYFFISLIIPSSSPAPVVRGLKSGV